MSAPPDQTDNRLTLADGRALGWAEFGDPAGFPVFSFHGWPGSRFQGERFDDAGWITGVRIIAPDRPGFGLSTFQPARGITDWPADVAALADSLGVDRFAIIGASGGGPYALACAAMLPDRLTGVAVASSLGPPESGADERATLRRRALRATLRHTRVLPELGVRLVSRRVLEDPENMLDRATTRLPPCDRAIVSKPEIRAISVRDVSAALADGGRAAAWDLRLLSRPWGFWPEEIAVDVHLWFGGMDRIVEPMTGHFLARTIPSATAHFQPNEGHFLVIPHAIEILATLSAAS